MFATDFTALQIFIYLVNNAVQWFLPSCSVVVKFEF